jgi:hypothetical protein
MAMSFQRFEKLTAPVWSASYQIVVVLSYKKVYRGAVSSDTFHWRSSKEPLQKGSREQKRIERRTKHRR